MSVAHSHYSQSPEEVPAARGTTARSTSLDIRGVETVHSQCRLVRLNRKISNCSEVETAKRDQPSVNPPSTDRNIFPSELSQAAHATAPHLTAADKASLTTLAALFAPKTTCATCSYLSSTACTNLDGPLQTTASTRACRLYFCIGDVERGL